MIQTKILSTLPKLLYYVVRINTKPHIDASFEHQHNCIRHHAPVSSPASYLAPLLHKPWLWGVAFILLYTTDYTILKQPLKHMIHLLITSDEGGAPSYPIPNNILNLNHPK